MIYYLHNYIYQNLEKHPQALTGLYINIGIVRLLFAYRLFQY